MSFYTEVKDIAHHVGGAHKTRENRKLSVTKLAAWLQKMNIQIRHLKQLKEKHLQAWIKAERIAGVADRTCQNMLSDVRMCLRHLGLNEKANGIKTKNFGVANAPRGGTKQPISEVDYRECLDRISDPGVKVIMELAWHIGLRRLEATMAKLDTLNRWQRELEADRPLHVFAGTKGGRPRWVCVVDKLGTLVAIQSAIAV